MTTDRAPASARTARSTQLAVSYPACIAVRHRRRGDERGTRSEQPDHQSDRLERRAGPPRCWWRWRQRAVRATELPERVPVAQGPRRPRRVDAGRRRAGLRHLLHRQGRMPQRPELQSVGPGRQRRRWLALMVIHSDRRPGCRIRSGSRGHSSEPRKKGIQLSLVWAPGNWLPYTPDVRSAAAYVIVSIARGGSPRLPARSGPDPRTWVVARRTALRRKPGSCGWACGGCR